MASKQFSLELGLSNLNKTGKSSSLSVSQVEEASKNDLEDLFQDFYDEYFDSSKIMKSSTTNVETSIIEEVYVGQPLGLPKMKFEKDHLCSACEQGKIHQKHHKSKMAFASNKPLYLLHMDLCGPMHVQSINGKRNVLVVVNDYSRYTWVFFLHSKDEASDVIISFIKKTQVNLQLQVQRVRTDNGTEFKNKTLAKFFNEVGITQ
nr:integrase, catalytic region, zinc finger, CCHC-type, peptidase aspartic, catalytic [Tanacetum cinerariifolium]